MKFLLILAAFAAVPCEAGIVTNGALTTGGQGVMGGTFTVQGANGLTTSSAALTGTGSGVYSLTTSSGIHVVNGKLKLEQGGFIEWPDASKSTTASAGGGSSTRVPLFASTLFSAATCFAFTNLSSPGAYSLIFHSTVSTTGGADNLPGVFSQVNIDQISRSSWATLSYNSWNGTVGVSLAGNTNRQPIAPFDCGYANGFISGQVTITTGNGFTGIHGTYACSHYIDGRGSAGSVGGGYPANMTSIQVCTKVGDFSGWAKLLQVAD